MFTTRGQHNICTNYETEIPDQCNIIHHCLDHGPFDKHNKHTLDKTIIDLIETECKWEPFAHNKSKCPLKDNFFYKI